MHIPFEWLTSEDQVVELDQQLDAGERLFVDTEFMRERTFYPRLALVQVHAAGKNYLIDPKPMQDGAPLTALLSRRPLVMHGCSEDLETFKAWPGFLPQSLADTQIAGAFGGHDLQCGYQRMVEIIHGVQLPKTATRTDWLRRPLSDEQLEYAVQDVHFLPGIHEQLLDKLRHLGRIDWWQEECQRLLDEAAQDADPLQLWSQIKGAAALDGAGRRALRRLAAWRDRSARARNLPRSFVLKDTELLALAQLSEPSRAALSGLALHPSFIRKFADEVLAELGASRGDEIPPPLPGMPDPQLRDLHKRLRKRVAEIAAAENVTPELLARRRWLEALARDPETVPAPMRGWRQTLVTDPLLDMLS